jgi:hypothetical protein
MNIPSCSASTDLFKNLEEEISSLCRFEKLSAVITAAGDEVKLTTTMKSLQTFGHQEQYSAGVNPTHPSLRQSQLCEGWGTHSLGASASKRKVGHPSLARFFEQFSPILRRKIQCLLHERRLLRLVQPGRWRGTRCNDSSYFFEEFLLA